MSRVIIYGLMALSLGLSGCQKTKMSQTPPSTSAVAAQAPTAGPRPGQPILLPPPGIIPVNLPAPPRYPEAEPVDVNPPPPPRPPINDDPLPLPPGQPTVIPRPTGNDPRDPNGPYTPPVVPPAPPLTPSKPVINPPWPPAPPPPPPRPSDPEIYNNPPVPPPPPFPLPPSRPNFPLDPPPPAPPLPPGLPPGGDDEDVAYIPPTRVSRNTPFLGSGTALQFPMAGLETERAFSSDGVSPAPVPRRRMSVPADPASGRLEGVVTRTFEPAPGQCRDVPVRIHQEKRKGVSFLFVVDTSTSLVKAGNKTRAQGKLAQVARGMPALFAKLPPGLDYRVGVLMGHGPKSPWFGKLYKSPAGEPAVLRGDKMSQAELVKTLERKMMSVPNDYSDAQGEAMNMNMFELVAHKSARKAAIDAGLIETGRELIVIVVTDEQDVCYDYKSGAANYEPVHKNYRNRRTGKMEQGVDPIEIDFFNQVCKPFLKNHVADYLDVGNRNHPIGFEDVKKAFESLRGVIKAKVMVNAIAYVNPQPAFAYDERDAEMGHGILDLVTSMNTGVNADLDKADPANDTIAFHKVLEQLGESANFQLEYSSGFDCQSDVHADAIDTDSLELEILDRGQPIARFSPHCTVDQPCSDADGAVSWRLEGGGRGQPRKLRMYPSDQTRFASLLRGQRVAEPTARIVFKTRRQVDPKTGLPVSGKRAAGPTSHGPIPKGSFTNSVTPNLKAPVAPVAQPLAKPQSAIAKPAPNAKATVVKVADAKPAAKASVAPAKVTTAKPAAAATSPTSAKAPAATSKVAAPLKTDALPQPATTATKPKVTKQVPNETR